MRGVLVLEQLIGIILAGLMLIFSIVGPALYYSFKFVSVKIDELRLQLNNFLRAKLEGIIRGAYKTILTAAVIIQTVIDILEIVATLKAEKAAKQSLEESLEEELEKGTAEAQSELQGAIEAKNALKEAYGIIEVKSVIKWLDEVADTAEKEIEEITTEILEEYGKQAVRKALFDAAASGFAGGVLLKVVAYSVPLIKRNLLKIAVGIAGYLAITITRSVLKRELGKGIEELGEKGEFVDIARSLLPIFVLVASLGALFGGYVIMIAEIVFRLSVPLMDRFFYTPIFENIKTDSFNSTLRGIGGRIKFCWKTFGAGKWNVNYMRLNPTLCSTSLITSTGGNIFIKNITDYMANIEEEYRQNNKRFFSNGRFVFTIRECNGTTGECELIDRIVCRGTECEGNLLQKVLRDVNITIYYKSASGDVRVAGSKNVSVGAMYISFAECVPWDTYTEETTESVLWEKEKFGERTLLHWAAFIIGAEGLIDLKCLERDTLYITFLIPKNKFINITFEEIPE